MMIFKDNVANCQNAKNNLPKKNRQKKVKSRQREYRARDEIRKEKNGYSYLKNSKKILSINAAEKQ